MDKQTNNADTTKLWFAIQKSDFEPLKKVFKWASQQDALNEVFTILEWVKEETLKGRIIISANTDGSDSTPLVTDAITYMSQSTSSESSEKMDRGELKESEDAPTQQKVQEGIRSDYIYGLMLNFGLADKFSVVEEGFTILKWIGKEVGHNRIVGSCDKKTYDNFQQCPTAIKASEPKSYHAGMRSEAVQFIDKLML